MADFYESFLFLHDHPVFCNNFQDCLDISTYRKDPEEGKTERGIGIWLECGPYEEEYMVHDIRLDSEGDTFEEAIIELAEHVREVYGVPTEKEVMKCRRDYFNRRSEALLIGFDWDDSDETEEDED